MTVYLVISLPKKPYIHCIYVYGSGQPYTYGGKILKSYWFPPRMRWGRTEVECWCHECGGWMMVSEVWSMNKACQKGRETAVNVWSGWCVDRGWVTPLPKFAKCETRWASHTITHTHTRQSAWKTITVQRGCPYLVLHLCCVYLGAFVAKGQDVLSVVVPCHPTPTHLF